MSFVDDDPGDASLGAAVEKLMSSGKAAAALNGGAPREDRRENRADRESHERQELGELDLDRLVDEEDEPVQDKGEEEAGDKPAPEGEDAQFLEIPGEEGEEPRRVTLQEAAEAWKKISQMDGDIATAVTKAETEAYAKQDEITTAMVGVYQDLMTKAQAAIEMMHAYAPKPPTRDLYDADPQEFYRQRVYYENYVAHAQKVEATIKQAETGMTGVSSETDKVAVEREMTRLARYIPEFGKPETREAKKAEILAPLEKKYGLTKEDVADIANHKAWRILSDLAGYMNAEKKAPEVRKAVQEKAPKLVNGRVSASRDPSNGRYVSEARKVLRETGTEEAAANAFIRSGRLRNLL